MGAKPRVQSKAGPDPLSEIGEKLGAEVSAMFGKRCLKRGGKAFAAEHLGRFVVKLSGVDHKKALDLSGSVLWDPSGKGRPMKAWVSMAPAQSRHWPEFAKTGFKQIAS